MSDAEDTAAVPTTPETTTTSVPNDDVAPQEDGSIEEPSQPPEIETPSKEQMKSPSNALGKNETIEIPESSDNRGKEQTEDKKGGKKSDKPDGKKLQPCPPPRSRCRARSRDMRQCKKHYREMIGQHEIRNDELEQRETDLRQRLEMLECSMPAVMVWNIWRMAQGAPVSHLREIVEKQLEPGSFSTCPSTPSQHWDCRVREVEAERKQALQRAEEARKVFAVKGDALKHQKQQIEEAKRLQEERKLQIAKLEEEVQRLQDALKKAQGDENSCETGECGEIQCRQMWLQGVSSVSSIHSTDLECLARLQDLAEAELCMKRQIADLERRECAYMRTLQQADEMWAKMEDDNASSLGDLKEQLESKIAANQQLADRIVELEDEIEKLRTQLSKASATLDEYKSKTFTDTGLGDADISTKEKVQQTPDEVRDVKIFKEEEKQDVIIPEEINLKKKRLMNMDDVGQSREIETFEYSRETDNKKPITETTKSDVKDPKIIDKQPDDDQVTVKSIVSTAEESVQVKPKLHEAESQSMAGKPDVEKGTATEEPIQVEATTVTEVVGSDEVSTAGAIGSEVSMKHSVEQQQQRGITVSGKVTNEEANYMDGSGPLEDKASLAHPLKAQIEGKDTGVTRTDYDSANRKEASQVPAIPAPESTSRTATEKASEASVKTTSELVDVVVPETTPEPALKPVARVSFQDTTEPASKVLISSSELPKEAPSQFVSETKSMIRPMSAIQDTSGPVFKQETQPATDAVPIQPAESTVDTVKKPVFEPILEVTEPEQTKLPANTLAVPIQTLIAWQNIIACLHKRTSSCVQCTSASREIGLILEEIRSYLGKDAPDLGKIECTTVVDEVQKSVALPIKKGPCICKPKTCPLGETPATVPAQANVKIQTVVDGQSQTSAPIKIPSRETRSPRSSRGSTKSKEEVKLMRIEEGTEPDPRMNRAKSIPEVKDETTVTVGDIASQTEAVRKAPSSVSKEKEKSCICPTGVCPKKQAKVPCEESAPGKYFTSPKKALGKEYKSTADAILAPAIRVRPSNERASSPPISGTRADDLISKNSSFACCGCGKPVTPVPSRKTTSIPMPTRSGLKSKVTLTSDSSDGDFLCCSCRSKDPQSIKPRYSSPVKSSVKSSETSKLSHGVHPASETIKTSCSREICCPCEKQEIELLAKTLTTDVEVSRTKTKPETKDVCCLAKISRDKVSKAEARRRKDTIKSTTPSLSHSSADQISSSSSTYKGSRTNDSSDSNVCCSSIEQVLDMTQKKGKGKRCACNGQEGKGNKERCVCGEETEPMVPEQGKHIENSASCWCPPKLFDKF